MDEEKKAANRIEDAYRRKKEKGMAPLSKDDRERLRKSLARKLNPRRFPGMSPKMMAILGFILEEKWTQPQVDAIAITSDGFVMASTDESYGQMNDMLGSVDDFERNVRNLILVTSDPAIAGEKDSLTEEEVAFFAVLQRAKIDNWHGETGAQVRPRVSDKVTFQRWGPGRGWHGHRRLHRRAAYKGLNRKGR